MHHDGHVGSLETGLCRQLGIEHPVFFVGDIDLARRWAGELVRDLVRAAAAALTDVEQLA
jgi:hypothetical protein